MNKNTICKKQSLGFTLIEMMVTVSVAAILLSIAVPSFTTMIKKGRLTAATNEFVGALILARSEALKRNDNVSVCVSNNLTTCTQESDFAKGWIIFQDCDQNGIINPAPNNSQCVNNSSEQIIKVHEAIDNLSLKTDQGLNYLTYKFSGRINSATTVKVREENKELVKKEVVINRTGRVSTR